jgi:ADP-heptose:LPS heptosyltransferase
MMRIVALVPGGIGDQILFFPTLDSLKQAYPAAQIDVVVEPRAKDAYRVSQAVQNTIVFDFAGRNSLADFGNLLGVLRDRAYDIALLFDQSRMLSLLLWLAGIPIRAGYADGGNWFLTQAVTPKPDQYAATRYHSLLKTINIDLPCAEVTLSVPTNDLGWADAERKRLGVHSSGYVLIHPGVEVLNGKNGSSARYPIESWSNIVEDFEQRQSSLPIVVVREAADAEFVNALIAANPKLRVTTPSDPGKLAALIAGANLLLTTDSDALQLAIAVKTYTLALFGTADPKQRLPGDTRFVGLRSQTGQVADIAPQTVLEKVWSS